MLLLITYYYVITVVKFDWSNFKAFFKAFLDMFLIFQIFDRFVNIAKNFNPDDAQNVRNCLK